MRELSLFTGAGGGVLGTKLLGWTTIGYVEYEPYCQQIIKQRIADGILDAAPIFGDIRAFVSGGHAEAYQGMVDVITAGFPCQPFSVAGKQQGADDERNMWPATLDTIRAVRPRYVMLENVPGLVVSGYFGTILGGLAESGYDSWRRILSAAEMGAPHKRDRLWIVAHCNSRGRGSDTARGHDAAGENSRGQKTDRMLGKVCPADAKGQLADPESRGFSVGGGTPREAGHSDRGDEMAHTECDGPQGGGTGGRTTGQAGLRHGAWWDEDPAEMANTSKWIGCDVRGDGTQTDVGSDGVEEGAFPTEPELGRVANGMANRVDRLKAIGNGQVPCVAAAAWRLLTEDL